MDSQIAATIGADLMNFEFRSLNILIKLFDKGLAWTIYGNIIVFFS